MFKIIDKKQLAQDTIKIVVGAPQIAKKAKAGQFVVVLIDEQSERIPLTLADWDIDNGTISLIFQKVGFTTEKLATLKIGDEIQHILGPLGHPTAVSKLGTVVCIGGGVGIAEVYPVSRAFKQAGNRIIAIIGSRSKDLLILEKEMKGICDELFVTTDDGSYGRKGLVTDVLKELLDVIEKSTHTKYPDLVYCIGPLAMMRAVSGLTKNYNIKTIVSLNPIMVDATGMCGACRCSVGGKTVFGCVDGPDFDGHEVDFEELGKRLRL
ncbi:MAG: ferredoxin-NADP reductase [Omnitrophica WOR_2 bacterium RBG_13_41_10]|nr:MAG: ferredoxin-NADP reductase [Omnitrophica WOR_2 bacterium RBG_13_41_10]